jgi:hypothetical protein
MQRNIIACVAGMSTKSVVSIGLNVAWYLSCLAIWPDTFRGHASTFPWWFFGGLLVATAASGVASGLVVAAIATKPARRLVIIITVVMLITTFVLTESGAIAIWIPVWVGHLRRIVLCATFWYSARWMAMRIARQGQPPNGLPVSW